MEKKALTYLLKVLGAVLHQETEICPFFLVLLVTILQTHKLCNALVKQYF